MSPAASRYLKIWIALGLFAALLLTGIIGNLVRGNYIVLPLLGGAILVAVGFVWLSRLRVRYMFRDATPERLINHYHSSVRRIPHANAVAAYLSALAASVYGRFDLARQELEAVNWDETPAAYRGHRLHVLAMMALLEDRDVGKAVELARQATSLESQEQGSRLQIVDDVIQVVAEQASDDVMGRVERIAKRQHGLMPALCIWALTVHYNRKEDKTRADEFRKLLVATVPRCKPLLQ